MKRITRTELTPVLQFTKGGVAEERALVGMTETSAKAVLDIAEGDEKRVDMKYVTYALDAQTFYDHAQIVDIIDKGVYEAERAAKLAMLKKN